MILSHYYDFLESDSSINIPINHYSDAYSNQTSRWASKRFELRVHTTEDHCKFVKPLTFVEIVHRS